MTEAFNQQPNRLDRIEQMLLLTTTALGDTARQQQANTQAIAQVTARLDQLTLKVDNLTESVGSLNEDVVLLADYFTQVIQNAETDRETFQAEIRRIWEYLLDLLQKYIFARGGKGKRLKGKGFEFLSPFTDFCKKSIVRWR